MTFFSKLNTLFLYNVCAVEHEIDYERVADVTEFLLNLLIWAANIAVAVIVLIIAFAALAEFDDFFLGLIAALVIITIGSIPVILHFDSGLLLPVIIGVVAAVPVLLIISVVNKHREALEKEAVAKAGIICKIKSIYDVEFLFTKLVEMYPEYKKLKLRRIKWRLEQKIKEAKIYSCILKFLQGSGAGEFLEIRDAVYNNLEFLRDDNRKEEKITKELEWLIKEKKVRKTSIGKDQVLYINISGTGGTIITEVINID